MSFASAATLSVGLMDMAALRRAIRACVFVMHVPSSSSPSSRLMPCLHVCDISRGRKGRRTEAPPARAGIESLSCLASFSPRHSMCAARAHASGCTSRALSVLGLCRVVRQSWRSSLYSSYPANCIAWRLSHFHERRHGARKACCDFADEVKKVLLSTPVFNRW